MQTATESTSENIAVDYNELRNLLKAKTFKKAPQALRDRIKNIPNILQNPKHSSAK